MAGALNFSSEKRWNIAPKNCLRLGLSFAEGDRSSTLTFDTDAQKENARGPARGRYFFLRLMLGGY
jgi:hypothetical protein